MRHNNRLLWLFGVLIVVAASGSFLFFSKSFFPALPMEDLSKREVIRKLEASTGELILLQRNDRKSWYGYNGHLPEGKSALQQLMLARNMTFIEQLGSGYFFEDAMENRVVVESQKWTRHYILFEVPN